MQFSWVVCFASQGILSLFNFCKKHLGYWQFLRIATALALINKLHHINGFFQFVFPPSSTGEAVELQLHLVSPKHRQHDTLSVMPTDRCLISLLVFLLLMLATSAQGQGRRLEVIPLSVSAAWDGFHGMVAMFHHIVQHSYFYPLFGNTPFIAVLEEHLLFSEQYGIFFFSEQFICYYQLRRLQCLKYLLHSYVQDVGRCAGWQLLYWHFI